MLLLHTILPLWVCLGYGASALPTARAPDSPFKPPPKSAQCATFAQKAHLAQYNVTVVNSTAYAAGSFSVYGIKNQYSFCQINATVTYGGNNTLQFLVWLPEISQWGGSFTSVGNGGMAGTIDTSNMMTQLNSGFAVGGGDGGHHNNPAGAPNTYIPYMHNLDEAKAWIHNAISLFTPAAKQLVNAYYNSPAKYSYYNGCSTGGAQAFALAQLHPDMFDGIIGGSPAPWYSHLMIATLWNTQATNSTAAYLPQAALTAMTSQVLDACDALDGVTDRLLENPLKCEFDVNQFLCGAGGNESTCLTKAQLKAAKKIYAGPPISSITGEIYPGLVLGSETEWAGQENFLSNFYAIPTLQNLGFRDANYDLSNFNYNTQTQTVDENAGKYIDEISVDLTAFKNNGGKFLVTQGWADPNLSSLLPLQYLEALQGFFGGDVSDFFNVVMIPGGGHCGAASNYPHVPATYHTVPALVGWVERGIKPEAILSTNPPDKSQTTRKLCTWPQTANYVSGDVNDWNSYVCESYGGQPVV